MYIKYYILSISEFISESVLVLTERLDHQSYYCKIECTISRWERINFVSSTFEITGYNFSLLILK